MGRSEAFLDLKSFFPSQFSWSASLSLVILYILLHSVIHYAMRFPTSFIAAAGLLASVFAAPIAEVDYDGCDSEIPSSSAAAGACLCANTIVPSSHV